MRCASLRGLSQKVQRAAVANGGLVLEGSKATESAACCPFQYRACVAASENVENSSPNEDASRSLCFNSCQAQLRSVLSSQQRLLIKLTWKMFRKNPWGRRSLSPGQKQLSWLLAETCTTSLRRPHCLLENQASQSRSNKTHKLSREDQ